MNCPPNQKIQDFAVYAAISGNGETLQFFSSASAASIMRKKSQASVMIFSMCLQAETVLRPYNHCPSLSICPSSPRSTDPPNCMEDINCFFLRGMAVPAGPQNYARGADVQATCGRLDTDPGSTWRCLLSSSIIYLTIEVNWSVFGASSKLSYSQSFSRIGSTELPNSSGSKGKACKSIKLLKDVCRGTITYNLHGIFHLRLPKRSDASGYEHST